MDAVVKDAVGIRAADPGEIRAVQMTLDFVHLNPCVHVVHIGDIQSGQLDHLLLLAGRQLAGANSDREW